MMAETKRADGWQKVTGRARYAGDLRVKGMVIGKLVRSTLPHARIVRIDATRALAVPGVLGILTPEDVDDLGPYGHVVADRPVLPKDVVRFIGDPVAAVAAVDAAAAEQAAELLEIEYEALPAITEVVEALKADATAIHPQGNVCTRLEKHRGNLEDAWAQATHVYEGEWTFPSVYQYAMEPFTVLASWKPGRIAVWSSAQHPFVVRRDLAGLFGMPMARVRVSAPFLGGGFGSKSYTKYEPVAVALSRKVGRPVRLEFSVAEAMLTNRRHNARVWLKTGVDDTGRIVAREGRIVLDTGAYADNGPRVAGAALSQLTGAYRVDAYAIEALAVYTNKGPAGSYRAIGKPQALWAVENQMDQIAVDLGMDPLELRRLNVALPGDVLRDGERPISPNLPSDLDVLAKAAKYDAFSGISCAVAPAGASPVSVAMVRLHPDQSATLVAASTELGQGAKTVMAEIAGRALSIPSDRIFVVSSDTDADTFDRSTGASRSTTVMGRAVQAACQDALKKASDLGRSQEVVGVGYSGPYDGLGSGARPVIWETGMAVAEASIDEETGIVHIDRYCSLADVGKAILPELCEGQEEGVTVQGIGHTLYESLEWQDGMLLNGNLVDYPVPGWDAIPEEWGHVLVENHDGPGPYGSTGMGEGGMMPVAPAIAGSLRRKYGMEWFDLPLTPERVWRKLQNRVSGFNS